MPEFLCLFGPCLSRLLEVRSLPKCGQEVSSTVKVSQSAPNIVSRLSKEGK